jgi:hypothetical protein
VQGESGADLVGLPNIDLSAAGAILAVSCIGVSGTGLPTFRISFTIDELQITGALGITVAESILGTSISVLALATISFHLHKVKRTVESTVKVGIIHSVSEFLVLQLEELVGVFGVHQVVTRAHIPAVRALSHETQSEAVTRSFHAICVLILCTSSLDDAVFCAGFGIGAKACVPGIASVAVVGLPLGMEPAPIGIDCDITRLGLASTSSAFRIRKTWMCLLSLGSRLLSSCNLQSRNDGKCSHHSDD